VAEIDAQHRHVLEVVNQLHQAMKLKQGRDTIARILCQLIAETRTHFGDEERLMSRHGYPQADFDRHKAEHKKLLQEIDDLERRFSDGDLLMSFSIMMDIRAWAMKHIVTADKALGVFLNSQNKF
jgi:hemerythrin-like metal-binding protein